MRLIQQKRLYFREGNSDKVYEVDLCEAGEGEFLVNFRYGRRGTTLREGTKTTFPEPLEQAQKIFDALVNSKLNKGYRSAEEAGEVTPEEEAPAPEPTAPGTVPLPGNPAQRAATLKRLDQAANSPLPAKDWKVSRIIWRAGELRLTDALPALATLAKKATDPITRYSIAWAVGKIGLPEGASIARELTAAPIVDPPTHRIAAEALLAILPAAERDALIDEKMRALPDAIAAALEKDDTAALRHALDEHLARAHPPHDCIELLYQIGSQNEIARTVVHDLCKTIPLKPPFFKHVRHLYKAAEFRADSDLFGLLAYRIEKSYPNFSSRYRWYDPSTRKAVLIKEEVSKPNSRIGFSDRTRAYLRQRTVRTLRRAGELEDPQVFITLATGVLTPFDDEFDRQAITSDQAYLYDQQSQRYQVRRRYYDDYAKYAALNYLLYTNSPRYVHGKNRWPCADGYLPDKPTIPDTREEAFPQLWDQAPDALIHLLANSRCSRVHEFAVRVWKANPDFDERADIDFIISLFAKPYAPTQSLGLHLARARYNPDNPDTTLLAAMLGVDLDEARAQAIDWLRHSKETLLTDLDFLRTLLVNPHPDVQTVTRDLAAAVRYTDAQLDMIIPVAVVAALDLGTNDEAADGVALHIREFLLTIAPDRLRKVDLEIAGDLLGHPLEQVQLLGAHIFANHESPIEQFSDTTLQRLLTSGFASVRTAGMEIFAQFTDAMLFERKDVLASLCINANPDIRTAARPIVERLAAADPDFARGMVERFYPTLLHKESHEGLHADVLALLEGPLAAQLDTIPGEHTFRMIDSKYAGAQDLGLLLLKRFGDISAQPMREIARLGSHESLAMREYVHAFYRDNPDRIKADKHDALRIVDSTWDDSRTFAVEYFTGHFTEDDWSPSLLVAICDSTRTDVQDFGRSLITQFFKSDDGPEYLLKLSQHPSERLQLFASNYLARFAAGDPQRLAQLEPYLVTVLSAVNRGRVAKARTLALLRTEGLADPTAAAIAMRILTRQSVTIAIGDKAGCIESILDLASRWPELDNPLTRTPFPTAVPD